MVPDPLRIKEVRLFNVKGAEVTSVYASQVLTALQRAQNRIYGSGLTLREKGRLLERCAQNILRTILVNELPEEDLTEVLRGMLPSGDFRFRIHPISLAIFLHYFFFLLNLLSSFIFS